MQWRTLLHRWFVQYNPLYLLSAALVLGGALVCSHGIGVGDQTGQLAVAAMTELYALALIGGAALLTRLGLRRPALMLAMLVALYQWDLTLHTETCPFMPAGTAGWIGWLVLFGVKLLALGWAMQIRFDRRSLAAAFLAGGGLAIVPELLPGASAREATFGIVLWAYALASVARTNGGVTTRFALDDWGEVVLRRATRVAWLGSGALVLFHVAFWSTDHHMKLGALAMIPPLVGVRVVRREAHAWALAFATLLVTAAFARDSIALAALLCAASFVQRLFTAPPPLERRAYAPNATYRMAFVPTETILEAQVRTIAERARLAAGAAASLHVAVWTASYRGGAWPAHVLWLDVALLAVLALVAWRSRVWTVLAPLAPIVLPPVVHRLPEPHTTIEWGATAVGCGFVVLGVALGGTWWLSRRPPRPA